MSNLDQIAPPDGDATRPDGPIAHAHLSVDQLGAIAALVRFPHCKNVHRHGAKTLENRLYGPRNLHYLAGIGRGDYLIAPNLDYPPVGRTSRERTRRLVAADVERGNRAYVSRASRGRRSRQKMAENRESVLSRFRLGR